eukprot:SAG22_NODE_1_length_62449_cov_158.689270_9_plen_278_part_00
MVETFSTGPAGWMRYGTMHTLNDAQGGGMQKAEWTAPGGESDAAGGSGSGVVTSRSPWWVDYNHAPPTAAGVGTGAGYMHMLFVYLTGGPIKELDSEMGGGVGAAHTNQLVRDRFPRDLRGARLTFRMRGELDLRGAQLYFQAWGQPDGSPVSSGWTLTGQPLVVTREWSDQAIELVCDEASWTKMGGRHDRSEPAEPESFPATYGDHPLDKVLQQPDDVMLVLFPLDVEPMGPVPGGGDPHELRPGKDYPIWRHRLPEGHLSLTQVKIEFAPGASL